MKYHRLLSNTYIRYVIVGLWILLTGLLGWKATDLQVDFEFEKLFPINDPSRIFYQEHLDRFDYDNDYLLLVIEHEPLFDPHFLRSIDSLAKRLRNIKEVIEVVSPTEFQEIAPSPFGPISYPLIHMGDPLVDSMKIINHSLYADFFGKNGKSLQVIVRHKHITDPIIGQSLIDSVNKYTSEVSVNDIKIVGKLSAQAEFIHYIKTDFLKFVLIAVIICLLLLYFNYRSFQVTLLPVLIGGTSCICLFGIMAIVGVSVSIMTALIPPILLFVSTSDSVHLINAFRRNTNVDQIKRGVSALHEVFIAIALTSLTTAIGFFSLFTSQTRPIQEFGWITGIGVVLAFLITCAIGPIFLIQWQPKRNRNKNHRAFVLWLLSRRKKISTALVLGCLCLISGLFYLKVDAYLLEDLPNDSSIKQNFNFVDAEFGGSKPWEIAVMPTDTSTSLWDPVVLTEFNKLSRILEERLNLSHFQSPTVYIDYYQSIFDIDSLKPLSQQKITKETQLVFSHPFSDLIASDGSYGRITGFIPEIGSMKTISKNKEVQEHLEQEINSSVLTYQITGTTYLIDRSHELLSENLLLGLTFAIGIISIVLGLYFRSFKILIISLIPNLLPLLIIGGVMGWMDISLKLTTSIIFTIVFGIAVDDTIHFITAFERSKSSKPLFRLCEAFKTAGESIVLTTLLLVGGFSVLILSSFGSTYLLGIFLCAAMVVALLLDLLLLPLLLLFKEKQPPENPVI